MSYLRAQFVNLLDGCLNISRMNRTANLDSFLYRLDISLGLEICLDSESLCRRRVAIGDEIVHNEIVDVTVSRNQLRSRKQNSRTIFKRVCDISNTS